MQGRFGKFDSGNGERIMRVLIVNCFETYEHRVELLRQFFLGQGFETKVITSNWLHIDKKVRPHCPEGYEMLPVRPYYQNLSPQRMLSHAGFAKAAYEKMEEYAPDLLWVLIPPNSLAKTASRYKKTHPGTKLVMDFIDMWPETMPISKFKSLPPFSNWRDLRNHSVENADVLVTECDLFQTVLTKVTQKPMQTLYLARDVSPITPNPKLPDDRISLCYLGSINNIIDIPTIARILSSIEGKVELHIIGDGEKRQELIDAASAAGAEVIYHGKVYDRKKKQDILDGCHFGLNIMKDSVFVGLTMKSMDYWDASIPVINNIQGDTWRMVQENRMGINFVCGQKLSRNELMEIQKDRQIIKVVFNRLFSVAAFRDKLTAIMDILKK